MEISKLKERILSLPTEDRDDLLKELRLSLEETVLSEQVSRRHILGGKMG